MGRRNAVKFAALAALFAAAPMTRAAAAAPDPAADPFSHDVIIDAMRRAFDYQLAEQAKTKPDSGWIRAAFYAGVMAAYDATQDPRYLDAAMTWADQQGHWKINHTDRRFTDNLACTQVYADLYLHKPDPRMLADVRAAWDNIIAAPRPGRVDWWWCDSLFMGPPSLTRLAAATGDAKYLELLDRQFFDSTEFLYDPDARLYYRDKSYFPPARTKNGKKIFWSRGNGWVVAGLARVLQHYPTDRPDRPAYERVFKQMCARLAEIQPPDGLWRPSLADFDEFPMPETSGTAFFVYGITWGINNGILDRATYEPVARKGWAGLMAHLTPAGKLGSVQKVAGAPGAVNPADTHEYAGGAMLMAGAEMLRLLGPAN